MNTHRIEVFNRANNDAITRTIAHNLHLVLFPTLDALFNKNLGNRRKVKTLGNDELKLFLIMSNTTTSATKCEGGANHHGVTEHVGKPKSIINGVGVATSGNFQADFGHRLIKLLAVLAAFNSRKVTANHLDAKFIQNAALGKFNSSVKSSLTTEGRQQGVRAFLFDNLLDEFLGNWLNIGAINQLGIGHDGCRIGINQNNLVAIFFQHLARLGTGIVELARLANHDRTRPNYENALDVGTLRHVPLLPLRQKPNRKDGRRRYRCLDNRNRRP